MYVSETRYERACHLRRIRSQFSKTPDNYRNQLRYFEEYLLRTNSIDHIEEVKRINIKYFISKMDTMNRRDDISDAIASSEGCFDKILEIVVSF